MISFIVCSVREDQQAALTENLAATAGVEHEVLVHDNREANWGLARVYNSLAGRARHPLLCFLHEDVRFRSPPGWGRELTAFYARHPEAGVVGFAGSQVKSRTPSGWGTLERYNRVNLLQHEQRGGMAQVHLVQHNPDQQAFSRVVVLDGLCLFAPREVWAAHRFDEIAYPGFHLYDLDFSTQVAQARANYVCHTVVPEHLSAGSFGEAWRNGSEAYHRKWSGRLPLTCLPLTPDQLQVCESYNAYRSLRDLLCDPLAARARLAEAWSAYRANASARYGARLLRHRLRAALRKRAQR